MTDAPPIADGLDHSLDPRVVPLQRTIGWLTSAVLAIGTLFGLFVTWLANGPTFLRFVSLAGVWLAFNVAVTWHVQRWPEIEYRHTSYRVDNRGIEIRRGVYWRDIVNIPRSRVQHTDVSQGPIERRYGLGTLVVYTAGTDHAKVSLSGLDHLIALRIREHFLPGAVGDAI